MSAITFQTHEGEFRRVSEEQGSGRGPIYRLAGGYSSVFEVGGSVVYVRASGQSTKDVCVPIAIGAARAKKNFFFECVCTCVCVFGCVWIRGRRGGLWIVPVPLLGLTLQAP
jgi:hypothetical protein